MQAPAATPQALKDPWALQHSTAIVVIGTVVSVTVALFALLAGRNGWFAATDVTRSFDGATTVVETHLDYGGVRDAFLRLAGACAAATAGLLAWGRLELTRSQHSLDRQRQFFAEQSYEAQHNLAQQSQRTERFTRSVELLGHVDGSVRLGALYALEALARDGHDPQAVYDVVCAFARNHTPAAQSSSLLTGDPGPPLATAFSDIDATGQPTEITVIPAEQFRTADYDAALSIALRVPLDSAIILDLAGTVIVDRVVASLRRCSFRSASIKRSSFVDVSELDFTMASMERCTFSDGTLVACDFGSAEVVQCTFDSVAFREVLFADASISGSTFDTARCDATSTWPGGILPTGVAHEDDGPTVAMPSAHSEPSAGSGD